MSTIEVLTESLSSKLGARILAPRPFSIFEGGGRLWDVSCQRKDVRQSELSSGDGISSRCVDD